MQSNPAQAFYGNSIFWVEVDKIKPNPFQPRKEFDEARLRDLSVSIRQYGVIQPLVVTRREVQKDDGGLATEYELIAGERRLRASKMAGLVQVPVIIRTSDESDRTKLELAIIENLQREELNPIDRAKAFDRLVKEFGFKHTEIAPRVGKSRVYVSNTIRLLLLPEDMQQALSEGRISEGHTRPLLMLIDRPQEQSTLFREIMLKKINVRDAENIARRIAYDRVRKREYLYAPEVLEMEKELSEKLGTRVMIEPREHGGKLSIDFFGEDDLRILFSALGGLMQGLTVRPKTVEEAMAVHFEFKEKNAATPIETPVVVAGETGEAGVQMEVSAEEVSAPIDDRSEEEKKAEDENEFDPNSFSI